MNPFSLLMNLYNFKNKNMSEKNFTKENFTQEVLNTASVVLVDFWAPWCGPCRAMSPIITELADEMKGKEVKVGKVNIDEYPMIAEQLGIMSIPALFIFKGGKVVEKLVGIRDKDTLREKLEKHL